MKQKDIISILEADGAFAAWLMDNSGQSFKPWNSEENSIALYLTEKMGKQIVFNMDGIYHGKRRLLPRHKIPQSYHMLTCLADYQTADDYSSMTGSQLFNLFHQVIYTLEGNKNG